MTTIDRRNAARRMAGFYALAVLAIAAVELVNNKNDKRMMSRCRSLPGGSA